MLGLFTQLRERKPTWKQRFMTSLRSPLIRNQNGLTLIWYKCSVPISSESRPKSTHAFSKQRFKITVEFTPFPIKMDARDSGKMFTSTSEQALDAECIRTLRSNTIIRKKRNYENVDGIFLLPSVLLCVNDAPPYSWRSATHRGDTDQIICQTR